MKKKHYERPTMSAVTVRQQYHLLAGSLESNTTINVVYEEEDW